MTRILMVCLGNICRSPLAHGIMESKLPKDKFFVDSAGTGDYHIGSLPDKRSIKVAEQNGINISNQNCRQFQISDFDSFDLIYVMDDSNYKTVVNLARNSEDISKVHLILDSETSYPREVPDPYWGNHKDFEEVFEMLERACEKLSTNLIQSK